MGLKLSTEMTTGVVAEYWSIREMKVCDDCIKTRLDLHISQALKTAGKTAVDTLMLEVPHVKSETATRNIYEVAYEGIKASNMQDGIESNRFVDAEDVL